MLLELLLMSTGSHIQKIAPPYPNPRRWEEIRRLQDIGMETQWLMARSWNPSFQFELPILSDNMQGRVTASQLSTRCHNGSGIMLSSRQHSAVQAPTVIGITSICCSKGNFSHGDVLQGHSIEETSGLEEIFDENADGEIVDTLEMNDFWVKRLSQTVKRMKKKYKKAGNQH